MRGMGVTDIEAWLSYATATPKEEEGKRSLIGNLAAPIISDFRLCG